MAKKLDKKNQKFKVTMIKERVYVINDEHG
jgi:hypothetical protein